MKHVICPVCGSICIKYGKTEAGTQRWFFRKCKTAFSPTIDNSAKQLKLFLDWLFSKERQKDMLGGGRTFRRKTAQFRNVLPHPGSQHSLHPSAKLPAMRCKCVNDQR